MTLNAQGYFNCLKSYVHEKDYQIHQPTAGEVVLKEKIHQSQGVKPKEFKLALKSEGELLVIKLDGKGDRLFHFLDDTAKPWSKRCDFVIFNLRKNRLFAYCIEFKSATIPPDVPDQLTSSVSWCKSLHSTIAAYTGKRMQLHVTKYVFSNHEPVGSPYLDAHGKYLQRDHTVRHYRYADLNGMALADLENSNIEVIR
ncbi:hypothetical protein [Paraburkholderia sp. 35.1]|uniref:hypothetical protein n=1 Tax=Paraburkholderia sp. 35.1 TaxID=2991058 RepID=UPI003D24A5F0